jgi:recombination protein RecR
VKTQGTEELIMALSPTIEGDTTSYYIAKQLKDLPVRITTIARGISFGGELEYADEMTLAKSIAKRLPIENYVSIQAKN